MPIRPAPIALLATALMLGACGTRGPVTLTPLQQTELRAQQQARQKALEQARQQDKAQEGKTQNQDASPAVDTNTTKESLR